jgi:hypothetical protein
MALAILEQGYNRKNKREKKEEILAKMGWKMVVITQGEDLHIRNGLVLNQIRLKYNKLTRTAFHLIKPTKLILPSSIACFARPPVADNPINPC